MNTVSSVQVVSHVAVSVAATVSSVLTEARAASASIGARARFALLAIHVSEEATVVSRFLAAVLLVVISAVTVLVVSVI